MFQINETTMATITSVTPRIEKHGDDDRPAVSIKVAIEAPNTLLDAIDPQIRHALYVAVEGQDELPGVEAATPVLRCNSFDTHHLTTKHEGWTLAVDNDIDDTNPMKFGGVKVDKLVVEAKQGGSIVLSLRLGTSDVDADRMGWLAMHNGESIWITLTPPEKAPDAIDGTKEAFERDHPQPSAEDLFAAGAGPEDEGSEGGDPDAGQASKDALDAVGSPFGTREPDTSVVPIGARTARGRAATKKALAEGLAAHEAGAK